MASASPNFSPSKTSSATSASRRASQRRRHCEIVLDRLRRQQRRGTGIGGVDSRPGRTVERIRVGRASGDGVLVERRQRIPATPERRRAISRRLTALLKRDDGCAVGLQWGRANASTPLNERLEIGPVGSACVSRNLGRQPFLGNSVESPFAFHCRTAGCHRMIVAKRTTYVNITSKKMLDST